jgi:hypothetical protein
MIQLPVVPLKANVVSRNCECVEPLHRFTENFHISSSRGDFDDPLTSDPVTDLQGTQPDIAKWDVGLGAIIETNFINISSDSVAR